MSWTLRAAAAVLSAAALSTATLPAYASSPVTAPTATTATASGWQPRPAEYGVHETQDVKIRMSDGTVLRADVYRPAGSDGSPADGRFPVLLTQTPYNKSAPQLNFYDEYLVTHGYVQVIADVRGTGSSEGSWSSFGEREQKDGAELVAWAHSKKRPWSNGDVGLYGVSYGAINQFLTAAQHPAGLKAMFPIVPAGDVYRDVVASGGQIDAGFIPLWLGLVTATGLVPPAYTGVSPIDSLIVLMQHAGGAFSFQLPAVSDSFTGGDQAYDGPFYHLRSPLSVVDKVQVPTFVVGGEYDLFQRGEPMLYERLRQNGVPSRLVIGPWTHLQAATAPGLEDAGMGSLDELALRWFDRYLRGVQDPTLNHDVRPVTYYEIGSGKWRTAPRWMPGSVHAETFQLDGTATPGTPGALVPGAVTGSGQDDVYQVPVSGLCTRSASQWTAGIVAVPGCDDDQVNDSTGTSYETAPLDHDLHLMGPIDARLFASTTRQDGMLSVHVEDVAPDGHVERLTGGWQVLSHRALDKGRSRFLDGQVVQPFHPFTRAAQKPAVPGKVMRVDVEVFPTGAVLEKGHRLRITVQQMDVPHLAPTLPQLFDSTGGVVTLYHSPQRQSRIILSARGQDQ